MIWYTCPYGVFKVNLPFQNIGKVILLNNSNWFVWPKYVSTRFATHMFGDNIFFMMIYQPEWRDATKTVLFLLFSAFWSSFKKKCKLVCEIKKKLTCETCHKKWIQEKMMAYNMNCIEIVIKQNKRFKKNKLIPHTNINFWIRSNMFYEICKINHM